MESRSPSGDGDGDSTVPQSGELDRATSHQNEARLTRSRGTERMGILRDEPQRLPQGGVRQSDGSVEWRVWAPQREDVVLVTWPNGRPAETAMTAEGWGYFVHRRAGVEEGLRYAYRLERGDPLPDPASRWQPEGVHRPSAVFSPDLFSWSDADWKGLPREELVIYELHVGTFTEEGTLDAVIPRFGDLKDLGVTAIELMPLAQFPGERNWGYDGVQPFAVQNSYGGPRALQQLVDAAHSAGLAVFLDVVYNHLGPEGNYLGQFGPYFTHHYPTPWGDAVNFDDADCDAVRRFVIDNALMWVRDFHIDGLRLDAVHAIYDLSARHILAELQEEVQEAAAAAGRTVHVIAESNQNDRRLIDRPERGGFGLDGVWCDDFHHAVHALLTGEREGYYLDFGRPEHLAKTFSEAFVYDGCYSPFRRRRFGSSAAGLSRDRFVVCIHNHDQVGNRALGDRYTAILSPAAQRLACGLLLVSPFTPLLFMGEEYGETRPFPFFCSFGDETLIRAVREGRREEFASMDFSWEGEIPDPQDPATFAAARLTWQWPAGSFHEQLRRLYRDLLAARRDWPALRDREHTLVKLLGGPGGSESDSAGVLRIDRGEGPQRLVSLANLSDEPRSNPCRDGGEHHLWLSTEAWGYGGARGADAPVDRLYPYEMLILAPGAGDGGG